MVSFVSYRERSEVASDASTLAEHLRKIQVSASAVEVPTGCSGVKNFTVKMAGSSLITDVTCAVGSVTDVSNLRLSLQNSVFSFAYQVVFDSRTVSATPLDIYICGNDRSYKISVSALANISEPELIEGECSII